MNPDRDSGADSREECLPKVPECQFTLALKAPPESKYCKAAAQAGPPPRKQSHKLTAKDGEFTQGYSSLLGARAAEAAFTPFRSTTIANVLEELECKQPLNC